VTSAACRKGRREFAAGKHASALAVFEAVVQARPDCAAARYHLARASFALGEIERATRQLRASLRIRTDIRALRSLATIAPFDPRLDHAAILKYRRALGAAVHARTGAPTKVPVIGRAARKVLRVGYVSSFFDEDNWMKPVWGLIDHHDAGRVDVHLFSDAPHAPAVRRRARASGAQVHDISRLDNAAAARRIARSRLDVLVDLNQYSRVGRLPLFSTRLAPLVVAWFNIFGTSGMADFDALIGDPWLVRDGEERWYGEQLVKLPLSSLTFAVNYPVPKVAPPPSVRNGFVTFGSLSSLYKINDGVADAWAEILKRSPGSRLLMGNAHLGDLGNRRHTLARFAARGIEPERVTLVGPAEHYEFLRNYDAIDLALDTFPYNGGTTTTEAIWQGVPVIAFTGDRWISRTSASLLENAGLADFVCGDVRGYVETAVEWASEKRAENLTELRRTMRKRLKAAPVTDCARLARCIEDVYFSLWTARSHRATRKEKRHEENPEKVPVEVLSKKGGQGPRGSACQGRHRPRRMRWLVEGPGPSGAFVMKRGSKRGFAHASTQVTA
jgi:protein O-GlcNAc transferase